MRADLDAFAAKCALGKIKFRDTFFLVPDDRIVLTDLEALSASQAPEVTFFLPGIFFRDP